MPEYGRRRTQRWRKDYEPGKVCIHPGISEDTDHTRIARYGKVEPVGAKVCDIMNVAPKSELLERAQKKKEAIYLSSKREPLGAPFVRGHALPAELCSAASARRARRPLRRAEQGLLHPRAHRPRGGEGALRQVARELRPRAAPPQLRLEGRQGAHRPQALRLRRHRRRAGRRRDGEGDEPDARREVQEARDRRREAARGLARGLGRSSAAP